MKFIKFLTLSVATLGVSLSLNSCQDDPLDQNNDQMPTSDTTSVSTNNNNDAYFSHLPVYISSQAFATDGDKRADLSQSFPQSASASGSAMCIYDASEVISQSGAIKAAFERGSIIAVANPTEEAVLQLKKINGSAGALTVFSLQGVEMVAYDKSGHNYELIKDRSSSASQVDLLNAEAFDSNQGDVVVESRAHQSSFTEFARWLDSISIDKLNMTRSSSFENYSSGISIDVEAQQIYVDFEVVIPRTKIHKVSEGSDPDYLDERRTHIICDYKMNPVHVFSTQEEKASDYAGDYYILIGNTVARNNQCFDIYRKKHGLIQTKARGWFMTNLRTTFTLLDQNGAAITPNFYMDQPTPGTTQGSTTYSSSRTFGFNANVGAMRIGGQNGGLATVGFSASWTKSQSVTLPDVSTQLNTANSVVRYDYTINNIDFNKDNDVQATGLPLVSYNDLSVNSLWAWWVPTKQYSAAGDYSDSNFKVKIDVWANYRVQHYQSAKAFPGEIDHEYSNSTSRDLAMPERRPFGVLQIKNVRKDEAVGHVKVWQQDASGNKVGDPVLESSDGACQKEFIQDKVFAGTYIVEYETFNNNTRTGIWQVKDVVIKLGATEGLSRTLVTTIEGVKIG